MSGKLPEFCSSTRIVAIKVCCCSRYSERGGDMKRMLAASLALLMVVATGASAVPHSYMQKYRDDLQDRYAWKDHDSNSSRWNYVSKYSSSNYRSYAVESSTPINSGYQTRQYLPDWPEDEVYAYWDYNFARKIILTTYTDGIRESANREQRQYMLRRYWSFLRLDKDDRIDYAQKFAWRLKNTDWWEKTKWRACNRIPPQAQGGGWCSASGGWSRLNSLKSSEFRSFFVSDRAFQLFIAFKHGLYLTNLVSNFPKFSKPPIILAP